MTLDKLKILLGSLPVIDTLTLRLNNFQTNVFLQQDWSVANSHNRTSDDLSIKLVLRDQLFFIRANAVQDKRNFAGFTISILKSIFGSVNSSYYSTTEDNVNQFLGDHLHLLLAFEAFLNLDKPTTTTADATSTTRTEDPTGSAGYAWEFVIIIITFAFISYRRRQKKR